MPQRNVLFLIDALNVGGAQELLVLLARSLADRYRVVVCSLQEDASIARRLESAGAEVCVLGRARPSITRPFRFLAYALGSLWDILRLCFRTRPEVIHCHLSDAQFLGTLAALFYRRGRLFFTEHSPVLFPERVSSDPRQALRRAILWLVYRRARTVIAVSEETRRNLLDVFGLSPERVVTIVNGVPIPPPAQARPEGPRAALGLGPDDVAVLNVGRLVPVKGQIHLVEAMAQLAAGQPRLRLFIAGEGPCRRALVDRAAALGLTDRVRLLGDRDDVAGLWAAVDLAVVSSLSEGTSLAVIEAMAAGKPIVATAVGGNLDLLRDEVSALLVPAGDSGALARALARLADDPGLGERLGAAARDKARTEYSIEHVAAVYADVWER